MNCLLPLDVLRAKNIQSLKWVKVLGGVVEMNKAEERFIAIKRIFQV